MKKSVFKSVLLCVLLSLVLLMSSCANSAYDIAVKNGFVGSEAEWLESLRGSGESAYDIAVQNGFVGSEAEWLESLKGSSGTSYDIYDLYDAYLIDNPGAAFTEFLSTYLTVEYSPSQLAVNKALTNTVSIVSTFKKMVSRPFGGTTEQEYASAGSGVIYRLEANNKKAYIITNYHVIYDSSSITSANGVTGIAGTIQLNTYARMTEAYVVEAEFVGGSVSNDIAVLLVSGKQFDALISDTFIQPVTKGDSNLIGVGESVYAVGNPEALGISATAGVVSIDSEYINMTSVANSSQTVTMRVIRVDAAINGGNSGGGLYNSGGELIGIVNAKIVDESIENIGYAIPINVAAAIADSVIDKDGKKSVIGISTSAAASKTVYVNSKVQIIETVEIKEVTQDSLASAAGLRVGDFLQSATIGNGTEVRLQTQITRNFHLSDFILKSNPDEVLTLTLIRNNSTMTVSITLDSSKRVSF